MSGIDDKRLAEIEARAKKFGAGCPCSACVFHRACVRAHFRGHQNAPDATIARLRTIVDESCGMQPADLTPEELLTMLERKLFELRRDGEVERQKVEKIAALEVDLESVATELRRELEYKARVRAAIGSVDDPRETLDMARDMRAHADRLRAAILAIDEWAGTDGVGDDVCAFCGAERGYGDDARPHDPGCIRAELAGKGDGA